MANVEQFIEHSKEVIGDYHSGKLGLHEAASKINSSPTDYPIDGRAHPMLYKVADLAFDISEEYRSKKEDMADWGLLVKVLNNYVDGNWEPTCWILNAMFGEYAEEKLTHSFSVAVRRQNGVTHIDTAPEELGDKISKICKTINAEQTDERYLQNLASMIPKGIAAYKLADITVGEYLTSPYNATVG